MDKLKTFVEQNRALLDTEDPPKGHFDRFSNRLSANVGRKVNLWLVAGAAAIAGIVLTASLSLLLNTAGLLNSSNPGLASVKLSPEIIQLDEYYQSQITQKQMLINKMMTGDMKPLEIEIMQTLDEMGDSYKSIMDDIALSPRPDRATFVLTRYYQTQLDVLDAIIIKMQSVYLFNN